MKGGLNYVCWWLGWLKIPEVHVCLGLHARGGREGGVVWRSAVEWRAMIAAVSSTTALDLGLSSDESAVQVGDSGL
jgi:hypothetical protein